MLTAKEVAYEVTKALDEKKGMDLKLLKISKISSLADYFIICTGTSNTHINALTNAVEAAMDAAGEPLVSREGHRSGTWVLLDYGCVVLHVFTEDTRKFYDLERLWNDAEKIALEDMKD